MRLRQEHPAHGDPPVLQRWRTEEGVVVAPGGPQFRDPPRQSDQYSSAGRR